MYGMGLHSSPEADTAEQEDNTFEETEGALEEVPETQPTHQSLRPQGKLNMVRETARDEEQAATMATILAATKGCDVVSERQREIVNRDNKMIREALNRENEMLREERMAQVDCDTMNKPLVGLSPNLKYFWTSEKRDVVQKRRARDAETSRGDSSYTDPSTTYPNSIDFV
ncbi:hypothetical protein ACFX13_009515 [Malus domestica]